MAEASSGLSHPDYEQTALDHCRPLVLVRALSGHVLKPKTFAKVFEVLDRRATVKINSADEVVRKVDFRFSRQYAPESNEWGDFQHHRAVLGLISVGAFRGQKERQELAESHEVLKGKYGKFLLCSRLIALKSDAAEVSNGRNGDEANKEGQENDSGDSNRLAVPDQRPMAATSPHCKLEYGQAELDEEALEADMSIFMTTLFWLLEKARVEKLNQLERATSGGPRLPLLCAPFERRDFVGLDLDSRVNKRRASGRFRKHVGDLSLLCGLAGEAYSCYEAAAEALRSCNDWLWLANALEGLCAISTVVHYPSIGVHSNLRRNSSAKVRKQLSSFSSRSVVVSGLGRIETEQPSQSVLDEKSQGERRRRQGPRCERHCRQGDPQSRADRQPARGGRQLQQVQARRPGRDGGQH